MTCNDVIHSANCIRAWGTDGMQVTYKMKYFILIHFFSCGIYHCDLKLLILPHERGNFSAQFLCILLCSVYHHHFRENCLFARAMTSLPNCFFAIGGPCFLMWCRSGRIRIQPIYYCNCAQTSITTHSCTINGRLMRSPLGIALNATQ